MGTFNQDIILIFKLGFLAYLLDILTAKDLYKNCKYPITNQIELYLHHVLYIFSLTGWLSNNKKVLKLYVLITSMFIIHWYFNDNKCAFTEMTKKQCDINEPLRNPIRLLGFRDEKRYMQLIVYCSTILYSLYKIN